MADMKKDYDDLRIINLYEKSLFCKSWFLYVPTGLIRRKTSIKALSGVVYTELLINYGETVHTQNVYN